MSIVLEDVCTALNIPVKERSSATGHSNPNIELARRGERDLNDLHERVIKEEKAGEDL